MPKFSTIKFNRRRFLAASSFGVASLAAPALIGRAYAADEVTIVTWETYHEDDQIQEWSQKTGIKVNVIVAASNDEIYAGAISGAIPADIFFIETGQIQNWYQASLITPIDLDQLPEAANISPGLQYQSRNAIDGKIYGVPYNWGTQPLMYDDDIVTSGTNTWQILWDKKYAGKVNLFDDAYITFPMIALKVGAKDPHNLSEAEFELCRQAFIELRPQVKTIARGFNDAEVLYASGDAVLGYCQNVVIVDNLQAQGRNFRYAFPDEGTPTWVDNAVLSRKGNRPAVYQFLNDTLSIAWQSRFIASSINNGILTEAGARAGNIDADILKKTNIIDQSQAGFWDKMEVYKFPESIDRRVQMWNDFKAGTL